MSASSSQSHSDTSRLIEAIRSLDHTLRVHHQSPGKEAKDGRSLSRKTSSVQIGSAAGPRIGERSTSHEVTRKDKVTVEVRVVFLKIGEIDTQKEKYTADVFLQAKWREPQLDGRPDTMAEDMDWDEQWTPKLFIDNVLGEAKESTWYLLVYDECEECTVYEKRRYSGSFLEYLELNQFPFDTQDLTITVTSERSEVELELIEDEQELCGVNVQSFKDEQEWRLHRHVETWRKVTTKERNKKVFQNAKFRHPALSVACKTSRRPGFFVWNIFFVMFFISSLTFTTFSVDLKLTQNRLQLSFILLLTTVTFKFIVNQNLPRISYLTYLDKYILITMTILCVVCAWHALVTILISEKGQAIATFADHIVLIIIGSLFVGFHVVFIIWVIIMNKMKRKSLGKKEEEHENRQRVLETITDGANNSKETDSSPGTPEESPSKQVNGQNGLTFHHPGRKVTPSVGVIMEDS